jgi:hypothetical protein
MVLRVKKFGGIKVNFHDRSLARHKRTEWMTKTFLDRITLIMQFSKGTF